MDYDCLFVGIQPTVHSKLVAFQNELVTIQAVENDLEYWEAMSSALAVCWLDVVVKLLCMHGSYLFDQLGSHEIENRLVEAVVVLISQMPCLWSDVSAKKLGDCYNTKSEFMKGLEIMYSLAQKCMQLKPFSNHHKLMGLMIGILEENTEVR
ncbi:nuclear pore complex protein NUP85-like isoform X2 [Henckelia pumila]|uniref:nuclear pore complex protein NUP85-like isoform X2 n=1 Tax=Henckelia pumila TaxID=405737 RepID=UPI003C6DEFC9